MQHNHLQYVLICNMTNYNVINRNMIKWVPLLYHISITGAMRERERERTPSTPNSRGRCSSEGILTWNRWRSWPRFPESVQITRRLLREFILQSYYAPWGARIRGPRDLCDSRRHVIDKSQSTFDKTLIKGGTERNSLHKSAKKSRLTLILWPNQRL